MIDDLADASKLAAMVAKHYWKYSGATYTTKGALATIKGHCYHAADDPAAVRALLVLSRPLTRHHHPPPPPSRRRAAAWGST